MGKKRAAVPDGRPVRFSRPPAERAYGTTGHSTTERPESAGTRATVTGGTYVLVLSHPVETRTAVGALGAHRFPAGTYAYVGSALGTGGFARIERHRAVAAGDRDVRHWHVDYLLGQPATSVVDAYTRSGLDAECAIARRLPDGPVPGFGASDCDCSTHLAFSRGRGALREAVERALGNEE